MKILRKVAKKASVLRRRKSRSKMDVQGNPVSSNPNINDPSNAAQNENDDYVFYVEDNKYSKSEFSDILFSNILITYCFK